MGENTTEWSEADRTAAISVIRIKTLWLSQPIKTFRKTTVMNWLHDRIRLNGANCTQMHHHCNNIMKTGIKDPFYCVNHPYTVSRLKSYGCSVITPPPLPSPSAWLTDTMICVLQFKCLVRVCEQPSSTPCASRCEKAGRASLVPFYHQRAALVGCNQKGSWIQIRAV